MHESPAVQLPTDVIPAPLVTRVLLCSNQHLYRSALRSLVNSQPEFTVVQESTTALHDVEQALQVAADLVILDVDLVSHQDADVAALESLLQKLAPRTVLIITGGLEPEPFQAALRHGISGIVLKSNSGDVLFSALTSARRGQVWLDRPVLNQMFADSSHIRKASCAEDAKIKQLTAREREIVQVACTGLTNKQIGERLFISEATVRHHLGSVFAKLGVSTRSELVAYGHRHNLTPRG